MPKHQIVDSFFATNGRHKNLPPHVTPEMRKAELAAERKTRFQGAGERTVVPLTKVKQDAVDERHTAAMPKAADPDSRTRRIVALKKGECMSEVNRIDGGMQIKHFAQTGSDLRVALRNRIESSVRQAKQRTGNTYMIEAGNIFSTQDRLYIVAIVTCLGQ